MPPIIRALGATLFAVVFAGCASYVPPGPKADLKIFTSSPSIEKNFAIRPASPFPAAIAFVRAQGPRYTNFYLSGNATHRHSEAQSPEKYTIITVREVEDQSQLDRIAALPLVAGLTGLNRLLLPDKLDGEEALRTAAARVQADLLFLYTFDTSFIENDAARPLTVITLGLSPTRRLTAITTVSALLIDTRTGYLHGTFEVTEKTRTLSTSWGSADSADAARRHTERVAFNKLVDDFVATWPQIANAQLLHSRPLDSHRPAYPSSQNPDPSETH